MAWCSPAGNSCPATMAGILSGSVSLSPCVCACLRVCVVWVSLGVCVHCLGESVCVCVHCLGECGGGGGLGFVK